MATPRTAHAPGPEPPSAGAFGQAAPPLIAPLAGAQTVPLGWLRWPALGLAAVLAVAGLVLFAFEPNGQPFYPVCVFHRCTGLLCPGCGSLRAAHQLLHGHLAAAFHYNALLVLGLPLCAGVAARWAWRKARGQAAALPLRPVWAWLGLGLVVLFGIVRNLPCGQLAGLAPH